MASFWTPPGGGSELLVDENGVLYWCDACPCDGAVPSECNCVDPDSLAGWEFNVSGILNGSCGTCNDMNGTWQVPKGIGIGSRCLGDKTFAVSCGNGTFRLRWAYQVSQTEPTTKAYLLGELFLIGNASVFVRGPDVLKTTRCDAFVASTLDPHDWVYDCDYRSMSVSMAPY